MATLVRIYNKVAEIKQKSDKFWFFELWGQDQDVWRVEFQVRRQRLKESGIRTFNDLRNLQADLLRELATSNTTLGRPSDDGNRSRWPLHPLWASLIESISQRPQTGLVRTYDEQAGIAWQLDKNGKCVLGHLKQMAALLHASSHRTQVPTLQETIKAMLSIVTRHHSDDLWRSDVERRVKANELGQ